MIPFFRQLQREGVLDFIVEPITQSLLDQSGNGLTVTATNGAWVNSRRGRTYKPTTNGLAVTHNALLNVDSGGACLIRFSQPIKTISAFTRLWHKGNTTQEYNLNTADGSTLSLVVGATTHSVSHSIVGKRLICINLLAGEYPQISTDGSAFGNFSTLYAAATGSENLAIGSYFPTGNVDATPFYLWAKIGRRLTHEEISIMYAQLTAYTGAGDPKTKNHKFNPGAVKESTCVLNLDAGVRRSDYYYPDLSGNGNNGQSKGIVTQTAYPFGKTAKGNGVDGVVSLGAMNTGTRAIGTNDYSIGGWFHTGTMAGSHLFTAYNSTPIFGLSLSIAGLLSSRYHDSGGVNVTANSASGVVRANEWHHFVIVGDRSDLLQIYVDGVSVANTSIAAGVANSLTSNNELLIGAAGSYASPISLHNGSFKEFRVYNGKALSATEIKNWYNEYATKPAYDPQSEYWLPTLANVTARRIGNTDFQASTGTWKVSEDSNRKKWLENVVAGVAYMPSLEAYGTWIFEFYVATGGVIICPFIADTIGSRDAAGQDGYYFIATSTNTALGIGESVAGTPTAMLGATGVFTLNTRYLGAITRSYSGEFYFYIKGGSEYPAWTVLPVTVGTNPFTDATATTSKYLALSAAAGDKLRLLSKHQGVLTINGLEAIY